MSPARLASPSASGRRGRFPDASVTCEPEDGNIVTKPLVLFEILSPETERGDRDVKWEEYQRLPSLRHYVLIAQDRVRMEHYRRVELGWHYQDLHGGHTSLVLDPPGPSLQLGDVYNGLDLGQSG